MTYATLVLTAARTGRLPAWADERFAADVLRVRRHEAREDRTGVVRELRIATPRGWNQHVSDKFFDYADRVTTPDQ